MAEATLAEIGSIEADLGMIVARSARRFGSEPALVTGGRTLTYQALHDLCDRVASGLQELGVRPGDRVVADGEPGELMIRGPLVMLGYYGNEPATKAAIEPDGWMHTGDIASRDDEGHYFIVDRKKDLIITGGFNVYPAEIERVVASHPAVAMVAVGSVPDDTLGELARAYVVLRPGATATEAQIIEHCRAHLAAYKMPRSVRFVPDLPKTSTGKVMRRELKTLDR
jgi:long-chain acyl-CoA synthetase